MAAAKTTAATADAAADNRQQDIQCPICGFDCSSTYLCNTCTRSGRMWSSHQHGHPRSEQNDEDIYTLVAQQLETNQELASQVDAQMRARALEADMRLTARRLEAEILALEERTAAIEAELHADRVFAAAKRQELQTRQNVVREAKKAFVATGVWGGMASDPVVTISANSHVESEKLTPDNVSNNNDKNTIDKYGDNSDERNNKNNYTSNDNNNNNKRHPLYNAIEYSLEKSLRRKERELAKARRRCVLQLRQLFPMQPPDSSNDMIGPSGIRNSNFNSNISGGFIAGLPVPVGTGARSRGHTSSNSRARSVSLSGNDNSNLKHSGTTYSHLVHEAGNNESNTVHYNDLKDPAVGAASLAIVVQVVLLCSRYLMLPLPFCLSYYGSWATVGRWGVDMPRLVLKSDSLSFEEGFAMLDRNIQSMCLFQGVSANCIVPGALVSNMWHMFQSPTLGFGIYTCLNRTSSSQQHITSHKYNHRGSEIVDQRDVDGDSWQGEEEAFSGAIAAAEIGIADSDATDMPHESITWDIVDKPRPPPPSEPDDIEHWVQSGAT